MRVRSVQLVLVATVALLLTPTGASAAWTGTPTPAGPSPPSGGFSLSKLNAVDCSAANWCMAVGDTGTCSPCTPPTQSSTSGPLAEVWDGASWKTVTPPNTATDGIACPRQNFCFAVSATADSTGPVIERWNGLYWSREPTPVVQYGYLNAISCSGLLACTAIGGEASGRVSPLAEGWDGTGWRTQTLPDAGGVGPGHIACPLKRTCTAVGQTFVEGNGVPLAERWFGRVDSWGVQSVPLPNGEDSLFNGVSCPSGPVCFAVGHSFPTGTLAERRVGSTWSVMPTPTTPGRPANADAIPSLYDVSCPRVRMCQAVGQDWDATKNQAIPIGERFDGASWHLETIPNPGSGGAPVLPDVSCPSRFFCMAVGSATNTAPGVLYGTVAAKWTP